MIHSDDELPVPGRATSGDDWKEEFLSVLGATSSVNRSLDRSQISLPEAFLSRRTDPDFAEGWAMALDDGYAHLEFEILRRFIEGDTTIGEGVKYDFSNAMRFLNSYREYVIKRPSKRQTTSAAEVRASIDAKIEDLRLQVQREKEQAAVNGK